jgi:hypothetical protein
MEKLILLFSVPALVVVVMHELELFGYRIYPIVVKYLNFKPFTCELCLSFWTYLGINIGLDRFNYMTIFESFLAGLIGYLYSKQFFKY